MQTPLIEELAVSVVLSKSRDLKADKAVLKLESGRDYLLAIIHLGTASIFSGTKPSQFFELRIEYRFRGKP